MVKGRLKSAPQGAKARPSAPKPSVAAPGPRPAKNGGRGSRRGAPPGQEPSAGDDARPPARGPRRDDQARADDGPRRTGKRGGAAHDKQGGAAHGKRGGAEKTARPAGAERAAQKRRAATRSPDAPRGPSGRGARPGGGAAGRPPPQRTPGAQQQQRRKGDGPRPTEQADASLPRRSGRVALVGRPNVGKSTLLNAALGHPLAIVSPTPQTTRDAILGVVHHGPAEIALLDTPGLHRPRTELGRVMNQAAREAARSADVVVFVAEAPDPARLPRRVKEGEDGPPLAPHPGDLTLLADLGSEAPVVFVLNKVDRLRDKALLLPLLDAFSKLREFAAIVPISALREDGVRRVLDEVAKLCPEQDFRFEPDELTDRPTRFFAAEYVREQILRATKAEVPHASAVQIERYVEPTGEGALHIDATIHVERPGQKKILIGAGAEQLKRIGTEARLRIEELVGRQVNLKLWVRVTPEWRESLQRLEELGYNKGEAS
ncbi:GTPase Era [Sorangium sp. So ce315]|uniref:GTPase Era n=1 Tax=Sorangium sp. So ce315 TaxID=3133299 RepID=UPI003F6461F4